MTLLARNEADIVDAQVAFHLNAGVDFVIATDNRSDDGTTEILERYARAGRLHLIREDGDDMRQSEWVTRMARLAATEFGADWVINADADEFWWPRGGTLKDVLKATPRRFGVVRGAWRHFLPRPESEVELFERMTVRLCAPAHPGDKATVYHAHQKVAHRASADVEVSDGNHNAVAPGLLPLRSWYPIEVLHLSFRSREQFSHKARSAYEAWVQNPVAEPSLHHILAHRAVETDSIDEYYGRFVVDDARLERGLADGTLALDTRLRDAVRDVEAGRAISFPTPTVSESAAYLAEIAPLVEIDGIVRAEQRADALEAHLGRLERGPERLARLRRLARP